MSRTLKANARKRSASDESKEAVSRRPGRSPGKGRELGAKSCLRGRRATGNHGTPRPSGSRQIPRGLLSCKQAPGAATEAKPAVNETRDNHNNCGTINPPGVELKVGKKCAENDEFCSARIINNSIIFYMQVPSTVCFSNERAPSMTEVVRKLAQGLTSEDVASVLEHDSQTEAACITALSLDDYEALASFLGEWADKDASELLHALSDVCGQKRGGAVRGAPLPAV